MLICINCGGRLRENDRYCRSCGAKAEPIPYSPMHNIISCVYAPPCSVKYTCTACGHSFTESGLGLSPSDHRCPKCGAKCSAGNAARGFRADASDEMDEEEAEIDAFVEAVLKERERQQAEKKAAEGAPAEGTQPPAEGTEPSAEENKTDE